VRHGAVLAFETETAAPVARVAGRSHLYGKTFDKHFTALPSEAGRQVDWRLIELCRHALSAEINLCVAGHQGSSAFDGAACFRDDGTVANAA
jgi:hypothetical protein